MAREDLSEREALKARLTPLAEQLATSLGMEVVLVEVGGGAGRGIVRIFIDQPGGVTLDDCERFSKRASVLLDVEDIVPFSYVLEVSSPGLDRPLVREADFLRYAGKMVRIRLRAALEGRKNLRGRILEAGHGRVRIELAAGGEVEIGLPDIEKANLVIEL
jgi:ribosome maturation factor RimP